jgi:hypothetical protein
MSREYRALGRELRPGPGATRRSLIGRLVGWVFRHLPEILLVLVLVGVWLACSDRIGPLWTSALTVAVTVGLVWWRRSGRLPFTVALVPTAVGERVWLCCPVGVCAEDIASESDRLRAACFARDVRVTRDRRFSALIVIDVIRRDPLATTVPVTSLLRRFDVPRPRQSR